MRIPNSTAQQELRPSGFGLSTYEPGVSRCSLVLERLYGITLDLARCDLKVRKGL